MNQDEMKKAAAQAALNYIEDDTVIGVGTGSTTSYFIEALAIKKHLIEGAVASSISTAHHLKALGIRVLDLNVVDKVAVYVDSADECNPHLQLIKGGGGALTREKIVASAADKFVCIIDQNKWVNVLGTFPLAIEVIPMARSYVGRELVKLGGDPVYRENFVTDNGNVILDVYNLPIMEPLKLEQAINNIAGVVCHGLFARRPADVVLMGKTEGVQTMVTS